ncbi:MULTISPECIES: ABC transporter ATP-binding protein [unclassified Mesorhizobium]|uniref:ABC transporter ATP-binding protein n=1 Tax=unclassified Mesorhizobium TaxID=325217 RepID=UPI001128846B|nr:MULTISPECIES: ABC transporter ATP-binding protein [unclassified Mesorhizobium]TPJ66643.1 ABC transporter ATP-binding protein [Mesorhizobium sp. B2-6-1]TPL49305.1 ABC transporter ATP-binding protein [Mesorhizobium sp. B2-4-2]TPN16904.1 ABC transporter ATP-binding protein [Mesorhizobium sp. B2-1-3]
MDMTPQASAGENGASAIAKEPPLLSLRGVTKRFGAMTAVGPTDVDVRSGDFFALLGPSGCGKTTLLRMIAGFEQPTEGRIEIGGTDITHTGPERRPTNMVFQGYGLFPHMTVLQNVGYGLRVAGVAKAEADARCREIIGLVRLSGLAERNVTALSGGQQQRVALARALVMRPKILLLDEPLAALDLKLRQTMQEELRRIHREIGGTFVFVTHDQTEAMALANRIAVMESGIIVQEGSPDEIYSLPCNRFVATFIGDANLLTGYRTGGRVTLDAGPAFPDKGEDGAVVVIIRPEKLSLAGDGTKSDLVLEGQVEDVMFLGTHARIVLRLAGNETMALHTADLSTRQKAVEGAMLRLGWSMSDHVVVADTK